MDPPGTSEVSLVKLGRVMVLLSISALRQKRQEDWKIKASFGYAEG